jgi:hypothetical protein
MTASHPRPPRIAVLVAVPLLAALVLTLFAWPSAKLGPRDLPVGVAGPAPAAQAVQDRMEARDGAMEVHRYAGEAELRTAIEDRDVYGGFVASPGGAKLLTASAASPVVAQQLAHAAQETGAPVTVEDVVPAPPAGMALGSAVLPLVLAGILTGLAGVGLASSARGRVAALGAVATVVGLAATAIVDSWLGVVGDDWLANAAALTLVVAAIAAVVAGAAALAGKAGAALAALTMVLVGNPFSGAASAPELLPQPVGWIGQLLPPGAGANLLRSTGYFHGEGAGDHALVLAAWALVGLTALVVAAVRLPRRAPVPAQATA